MENIIRNVLTDYGELWAIIFAKTCPCCESPFEYGMAYIESEGYRPLTVNGCRIWKAGEDLKYKVDMSERVYLTYAGVYRCCGFFCEKILHYLEVKERNIQNSTRRRKERRDAIRALRPDPVCKYCNQPFKSKRSDALYCSDKCRQQAHRKRISDSLA